MRASSLWLTAVLSVSVSLAAAQNRPEILSSVENPAGTQITINGSGFGSGTPAVALARFALTVESSSDTSITADLPAGIAPGIYLLEVTPSHSHKVAPFAAALGQIGPPGPVGPQGPVGLTGPIGLTGTVGPIGPVGPQGANGLMGAVGPVGSQGPIGLTGPMGPVGAVGPAGSIGPIGPIGPQGLTGVTGAVGPIGPAGSQGPIGLTGPKGDTGPQGPAGITGPKGDTGPQGLTGLTGATGAQGIDGATGPKGDTGPAGAQGPAGLAKAYVVQGSANLPAASMSVPRTVTTVLTMQLPAGKYLVQAKANLTNTDQSEVFGFCQIQTGGFTYDTSEVLVAPNHPTSVGVSNLTTLSLGSAATVTYVCTNEDWALTYADSAQMTATLLDSLN